MNTETSDNMTATATSHGGLNGTTASNAQVQRVAEKAHAAVDTLAQSLSSGTDKVMGWQEEYGEAAREQIRANPIAVVLGAFAVGYLFAKVTR